MDVATVIARLRPWLTRVAGAVFVLFGLKLALER